MTANQIAATVLFLSAIVQGISAIFQLLDRFKKRHNANALGILTAAWYKTLILPIALSVGAVGCSFVGLWFVFYPSQVVPVSITQQPANTMHTNSNNAPQPNKVTESISATSGERDRQSVYIEHKHNVQTQRGSGNYQAQSAQPISQVGANNQQTVIQPGAKVSQSGGGTGSCTQNVLGGNNNTNNCAPPQRHLTALQKSQIAAIKAVVNTLPVYCFNTDPEGCAYAKDLRQALVDAGMDEGQMVGQNFGTPEDSRVYVAIHSREQIPPGITRIIEILRSSGIEAKVLIVRRIQEGHIELWIGY